MPRGSRRRCVATKPISSSKRDRAISCPRFLELLGVVATGLNTKPPGTHLPSCTVSVSVPVQRKAFIVLQVMAFSNQAGMSRLITIWNDIAKRVVLMRVRHPLRFMSFPFQVGKVSTILLAKGCSADLGSLVTDSENVEYPSTSSGIGLARKGGG
jgi:hypothetical protein